jgi:hypothetical protein
MPILRALCNEEGRDDEGHAGTSEEDPEVPQIKAAASYKGGEKYEGVLES